VPDANASPERHAVSSFSMAYAHRPTISRGPRMVRMSTKNKPPPPVLHVEAVIPMFDASNSPRAAANDIETRKDTSCRLGRCTVCPPLRTWPICSYSSHNLGLVSTNSCRIRIGTTCLNWLEWPAERAKPFGQPFSSLLGQSTVGDGDAAEPTSFVLRIAISWRSRVAGL